MIVLQLNYFGIETGTKILHVIGMPFFRTLNQACMVFPFITYVYFVLTGLLAPAFSFLMLIWFIPLFRELLLRNSKLLRVFIYELNFVWECLSIILIMTPFGVLLGDERNYRTADNFFDMVIYKTH